jgi:hypothetical protein
MALTVPVAAVAVNVPIYPNLQLAPDVHDRVRLGEPAVADPLADQPPPPAPQTDQASSSGSPPSGAVLGP